MTVQNPHIPFDDEGFTRVPNQFNELYKSDDTFVRIIEEDFNDPDSFEYEPLMEINDETVELGKQLLQELNEDYDIKTAEYNAKVFSTTKNKTGRGVLIASNLLEGQVITFDELEKGQVPQETHAPGKQLVERLTKYFLDKYKSGGPFLYDICRISQYTLIDGEFVLHDVAPMILDQEAAEDKKLTIESRFQYLTDMAHTFMEPDEFRQWQTESRKVLKAPKAA